MRKRTGLMISKPLQPEGSVQKIDDLILFGVV